MIIEKKISFELNIGRASIVKFLLAWEAICFSCSPVFNVQQPQQKTNGPQISFLSQIPSSKLCFPQIPPLYSIFMKLFHIVVASLHFKGTFLGLGLTSSKQRNTKTCFSIFIA